MAGWRDLPTHTAAPPDRGYRGALARHAAHVRSMEDDGIFLLFYDELGRVISSTSTSSQVTRMEPQPEPQPTATMSQALPALSRSGIQLGPGLGRLAVLGIV